ncbi:hypothetical protein [Pseudoxanthomonas sacheonensis]|uniref:hypothetical protein n=1 Tax=Pseudoxanthomonas sacheonensis TaxID=443615 RepID=UPI001478CC03|nr:hypothetical protein [Pseudoxanthomonas sacheonensis]
MSDLLRGGSRFCLSLCKREIEGDLLFAGSLLESNIKIKSKSPLAPLFQRGESNV